MVVSGTTGHLLRCTKNVSSTAKFSVLSSKYLYGHKSNVNFQNVVVLPRLTTLYCNCRRFHYTDYFENSRESRSTFTKLSPQEIFAGSLNAASFELSRSEKQLPVDNDVDKYIRSVNEGIGDNVLCVYDDKITLNCTVLREILQKYSFNFIKNEFHDNLFLQLSLTKFVQDSLNAQEPRLERYFKANGLSRSAFRDLASYTKQRSMRLDLNSILLEFLRPQLEAIVTPIKTTIINFLEQARTVVLKLYVTDDGSGGFLQIITSVTNPIVQQVADYILSLEDSINTVVDDLLYNNGTTTTTTTTTTTVTTPVSA